MIISRWPLLLGLFLFASLSQYFFWQIGDDSYIYFRYVDQSINGFWGQWTQQLAPVEGYSSPLWFILLWVMAYLSIPVQVGALALGVLLSALSLLMIWRLSYLISHSKRQADISVLLSSLVAGFYYWGSSGLETPLYVLLYSAFAHALFCHSRSVTHYWLWIAVLAAMLSLTRPEGVFMLLPLLLISWCAANSDKKADKKSVFIFYLFATLPLLGWMLFRLSYYGMPLANTFYAKATGDFLMQITKGFMYSLPILLACLTLGVIFLCKINLQLGILLTLIALPSAFIVGGGGDWMSHFRLWQPIIPLLLTTLIWQCCTLFSNKQFISLALLLISCAPMIFLSVRVSDIASAVQLQQLPETEYQEGTMTHESIKLAEKIQQRYGNDTKLLIAVNHAGAFPWAMADADFIDMVGLNDAHIARATGVLHAKYDVDYVLNSQPDLLILNTRVQPGSDGFFYHKGYWQGEDALIDDVRFSQHYQATNLMAQWQWQIPWPMSMFFQGYPESWIVVYERKPMKD